MRTPTPNMISDHNEIHTQSDVTIAFLTRDPGLNDQDRPSCEFGVSNQRRNTNHIYATSPPLQRGLSVCGGKVRKKNLKNKALVQ